MHHLTRFPFTPFVLLLLLVLPPGKTLHAQNTIGLTAFDHDRSFAGYNLMFPHNQSTVYLLDNCGRIAHSWPDSIIRPGNGAYLMENGDLYVCKGRNAASNPDIHAGGGGELFEVRDWDNNLLWRFVYNDATVRLHHDIAVMPNGNVLAIAWERIDSATAIAAGRDPGFLTEGELWPDKVIEVAPDGSGGGTIVWEWRVWDHLVQNFDASAPDFADPAARPERIHLNYGLDGDADWQHANSISYHPQLDQIALSIPHYDELWIIDHSTTTLEAAGSSGGLSGKGGDLLFRWGNPQAYNTGSAADKKLFFNHDVHWVGLRRGDAVGSGDPDYGKLAIFNNRAGSDFSLGQILDPAFDSVGWTYPQDPDGVVDGLWGPADFDWTYQRTPPQDMYSTGLSSIQRLPNGNTLFCIGREGQSFEITPGEQVIWSYTTPLQSGAVLNQYDPDPPTGANLTFRMTRYPMDYSAFDGRDLSPKGYIEGNPDTNFCNLPEPPSGVGPVAAEIWRAWPLPARYNVFIRGGWRLGTEIGVYNRLGAKVWSGVATEEILELDVSSWMRGAYLAVAEEGRPYRVRFFVAP